LIGPSNSTATSKDDSPRRPLEGPAGRGLARLAARRREVILVACLDKIFFRRDPVLASVDPGSMTWFLGRKVDASRGETGAEVLGDFLSLDHVVSDAGGALRARGAGRTGPDLHARRVPRQATGQSLVP